MTAATEHPHRPAKRVWMGLGVLLLAAFMGQVDMFIVNVAAPEMQTGLQASFGQVQFVINGYVIAYAAGMITGGRLGDRLGRRRVFWWGTAVFTLASLLCALAPSAGWLITARVAQGLGASVMMPQVLSIIRASFADPQRRARAVGVYGATIGFGVIAGLIGGGVLVSLNVAGLGWRTIFLINVPIGLVMLLTIPFFVADSRSSQPPPTDLVGALLSGLLLPAVFLPLTLGTEAGWPNWCWPMLAGGLALLAVFLGHERAYAARGREPIAAPRLFGNRGFGTSLVTVTTFFSGNAGLFLVLTYHLQAGLGLGPLATGLAFAPLGGGFAAASAAGQRLAGRFGPRTAIAGTGLMVTSLLLIPIITGIPANAQAWVLALILSLSGLGQGLVVAQLLSTVLSLVQAEDAGSASALVNTTTQAGMATGTALIGTLYHTILGTNPNHPTIPLQTSDLTTAFTLVALVLAALAAATGVLLEQLRRIGRNPPTDEHGPGRKHRTAARESP